MHLMRHDGLDTRREERLGNEEKVVERLRLFFLQNLNKVDGERRAPRINRSYERLETRRERQYNPLHQTTLYTRHIMME